MKKIFMNEFNKLIKLVCFFILFTILIVLNVIFGVKIAQSKDVIETEMKDFTDLTFYCKEDQRCSKKLGYLVISNKKIYISMNIYMNAYDGDKFTSYLSFNNKKIKFDAQSTVDKIIKLSDNYFMIMVHYGDENYQAAIYDDNIELVTDVWGTYDLDNNGCTINKNAVFLNVREEDLKDKNKQQQYVIYVKNNEVQIETKDKE